MRCRIQTLSMQQGKVPKGSGLSCGGEQYQVSWVSLAEPKRVLMLVPLTGVVQYGDQEVPRSKIKFEFLA